MEKINFVNNSEPYLSAENLNQMQSNMENEINKLNREWKQATIVDYETATITIPISWDDLKEISIRTLGTDNASFAYLTIPKEQWHNDGSYPLLSVCWSYAGSYCGYAQYTVITKNTNNFVIKLEGNSTGLLVYYK